MSNNTNVPVIDVALLRKTLEHIEGHQDEWNQSWWRTRADHNACGTAMCFAGWAADIMGCEWSEESEDLSATYSGQMVVADEADREWAAQQPSLGYGTEYINTNTETGVDEIHVAFRAQRLLGLTYDQRSELFAGGNDLDELREIVDRLEQEALQS